jgi:hypothetical protein
LALTVSAGQLALEVVADALAAHRLSADRLSYSHKLNDTRRTRRWRSYLKRRSAYGALAEEFGAQLWTFGGLLAETPVSRGLPVRLFQMS